MQNLFDKFNIIYENTKWSSTDIIILGEYAISAPYTEVKVLPGKDGRALDRLTKIVSSQFIYCCTCLVTLWEASFHSFVVLLLTFTFSTSIYSFQLEGERKKWKLDA